VDHLKRRTGSICLFLFAATLLAHFPVLRGGFVNWDDPANLLENPDFRGFSGRHLAWMWTARHLGVFEPLGWMLKAAIWSVFGLEPAPFHAVSWLLHGLNVILFYRIARRLVLAVVGTSQEDEDAATADKAALLAALFFGVHPLRVECVAWATAQPYLLAATFALGAVLAYLRAAGGKGIRGVVPVQPDGNPGPVGRTGWLLAAFVLYVASLLAKPIAVPLPAVLLILDRYPLRRLGGRGRWFTVAVLPVWLEKLLFAVPAAGAAFIAAGTPVTSVIPAGDVSAWDRIAVACYGVAFYFHKTLVPTNLSPFYPLPQPIRWDLAVLASAAFAAMLLIVMVVFRRRRPAVTAAIAVYLVWLVPVLGLVRHGDQLAADRYSYLSCLAPMLVGAAALARARGAARGAALVVVLAWAFTAWRQCGHWRDSVRLWTHALHVDADNWLAHNNLANALMSRADLEGARRHVDDALRIRPDYPDALHTLGILSERQGRAEDALAAYRRALEHSPGHAAAVNLSALLHRSGRLAEALNVARRAREHDTANRDLRNNLAVVLTALRQLDEAAPLLDGLVAEAPDDAQFRRNLGLVHAAAGRTPQAIEQFERALQLDALDASTRYHLAYALTQVGRMVDGIQQYEQFLKERPDDAQAWAELALPLLKLGRYAEAVRALETSNRLRPGTPAVINRLAWLLATCPWDKVRDGRRAQALMEPLARELGDRSAEALDTLAAVLAETGRFDEAAQTADRAAEVARKRGQMDLELAILNRAAQYRQGRPHREP